MKPGQNGEIWDGGYSGNSFSVKISQVRFGKDAGPYWECNSISKKYFQPNDGSSNDDDGQSFNKGHDANSFNNSASSEGIEKAIGTYNHLIDNIGSGFGGKKYYRLKSLINSTDDFQNLIVLQEELNTKAQKLSGNPVQYLYYLGMGGGFVGGIGIYIGLTETEAYNVYNKSDWIFFGSVAGVGLISYLLEKKRRKSLNNSRQLLQLVNQRINKAKRDGLSFKIDLNANGPAIVLRF